MLGGEPHPNSFLRPDLTPRPQGTPEPGPHERYVRSYLWLRVCIGALGLLLPVVLWAYDSFLSERWELRESMSGYYYTGARDSFTGTLSALAIFLIAYKVAERNLDNMLTLAAGVFAALVALCPTKRTSPDIALSPLQARFGERAIEVIHYTSAISFLACLGGLCLIFAKVEGRREAKAGKRTPAFWRHFHLWCAAMIGVGLVFAAVSLAVGHPRLFWPEAICVWAFGISWLMKGAELDILRTPKPVGHLEPAHAPAPDPIGAHADGIGVPAETS
jgi:hypothetical protein